MVDDRKASGRFQKFLDEKKEDSRLLPLVHATTAYSFAEFCDNDELNPQTCRHFNEEILYLFYGRPAYRTEDAEFTDLSFNLPIVFVFDPNKIEYIKSVYPFDTGAFFLNLYRRFFNTKSRPEDYRMPGSLEYAKKLVGVYYYDEEEYLTGRSRKNVEIPEFNFEAEGVRKLSQEPSFTARISPDGKTRDERSSSIEVHTTRKIDIRDATLAVILPNRFADIPEVVEALDRWNLGPDQVRYFEVIGFHEGDSWMGQIYSEVIKLYRDLGYLLPKR